jgi:hypothetical protein
VTAGGLFISSRADVVNGMVGAPNRLSTREPGSNVGPAPCSITPLWEWSIAWDASSSSAGLSATQHGAMSALSRALIHGGRSVTGQVLPMFLVEPLHAQSYYLRSWPRYTAVFDGVSIQWR